MKQYIPLGSVISKASVERCGDRQLPILSITMKNGLVLQDEKFKKRIASADTAEYKVIPRGKLVQGIHIDEANFGIQDIVDEGIVSPAYKVWEVNSSIIFPKYLEMIMRSPRSLSFYRSKLNGSVTRRGRMTDDDFLAMLIPFVDYEQQKKIVSIIRQVLNIITLYNRQILALDTLIKARFVEMFEGKYHTIKLGDVIKTTSGGTPSKTHPEYYEGGSIPWLTSGEINAGVVTSVKNYITEDGMRNSSAKMVPENSVVIAMYGATAGVTGILKLNTTTNQAVCSLLPNEHFVPEYLYYAVAAKKEWMISQSQGGGQPNISQGVIKSMKLIDAPINTQKQFAIFVSRIDKSKSVVQQALAKNKLLLDSLMQKYFG